MPLCTEGVDRIDSYPGRTFMLFTNSPGASIDTEFADLTEADFSGYARHTVSQSIGRDTDDFMLAAYGSALFAHNGGATSNTVTGWAMMTGTEVHYVEMFGSPISMADADDAIAIDVNVKFGEE